MFKPDDGEDVGLGVVEQGVAVRAGKGLDPLRRMLDEGVGLADIVLEAGGAEGLAVALEGVVGALLGGVAAARRPLGLTVHELHRVLAVVDLRLVAPAAGAAVALRRRVGACRLRPAAAVLAHRRRAR